MTRRIALAVALLLLTTAGARAEKMKALIIDGQNNHGMWPKTTMMMKIITMELIMMKTLMTLLQLMMMILMLMQVPEALPLLLLLPM